MLAAPPSGCDGPSLDWNSWKYGTNYPLATKAFFHASNDFHPKVPAGETAINAWDTFSMDPAGADYSQNGAAANAYAFCQWLVAVGNGAATHAEVLAVQPPLLSGEVAPYCGARMTANDLEHRMA